MKKLLLACAATAALLAGPASAQDGEPRFGTFGFDVEGMNRAIEPGDDFNRFANGSWLENTALPSDRSRYGVFTMLAEEAEVNVRTIIDEAAAADSATGDNNQLVGDLFASWMDADTIEARGLDPVQPYLAEIAAVETHDDAAALFATVHHQAPYGAAVWGDPAGILP
jgi:putative endopeptidase